MFNQFSRRKRPFYLFVCIVFACCVIPFAKEGAANKPFVGDEIMEVQVTCIPSFIDTVVNGAEAQFSAAPFYYLLQKINTTFFADDPYQYMSDLRRVARISGALVLFVLLYYLGGLFGLVPAFLAASVLVNHHLYTFYVVESRPYMTWLFLFTLAAFLLVRLLAKPLAEHTKGEIAAFVLTLILLTLTAGAGMPQSLVFIFTLFWGQFFLYGYRFRTDYKQVAGYLFLTSVVLSVGFYYVWLRMSVSKPSIDIPTEDLLIQLQQGNYDLLKGVGRVLFPKGNPIVFVMNLLTAFGAGYSVWLNFKLFRGRPLGQWQKKVYVVGTVFLAHLAASVILGLLIVYSRYYFNQRAFIYYIVVGPALAALGAFVLVQLTKNKLDYIYQNRFVRVFSAIFAVGIFLYAGSRTVTAYRSDPDIFSLTNKDSYSEPCDTWEGNIHLVLHERISTIEYEPGNVNTYLYMRMVDELRRCGHKPNPDKHMLVAGEKETGTNWYEIRDFANTYGPHNYVRFCGKKVILR